MWSGGRRQDRGSGGLGQQFTLNLSGAPEQPHDQRSWSSHGARKRDSGRSWGRSGPKNPRSDFSSYSSDRDRAKHSYPKADTHRTSKSTRYPSKQRSEQKPHSILGSVIKAAPPPIKPSEDKPLDSMHWAVGSVRPRRKERSKPVEELPEDPVKQELAKGCSERHLFRKVFDGFQQYHHAECHKEELAKQTFNTALFRKVFDRLKSSGDPIEDDPEIAFLRELGWAPEGESEDLDDSPLTEEEIAAFRMLNQTKSAVSEHEVHNPDDGSSTCTSDSEEDDSEVPLFF